MSDPRDEPLGGPAVVRTVGTETLCAHCVAERAQLAVERVVKALAALEEEGRVVSAVGRCRSCLRGGRRVFRLNVDAARRVRDL
jgi:predicted Rossmann fold nucleotide-binding protein DprA/Smf involved in DNA uptake